MKLKNVLALAILICVTTSANAQLLDTTEVVKTVFAPRPRITSGDHLMIQLSNNIWTGLPDSIDSRTRSFNKGVNVYLMLNKPFRGNNKMALGIGIGVSNSNMFFKKTFVDINANVPILPFIAADSINHFKKYKVATTYLEVPLELRFSSKPENPNKSVKAALGIKGGFLINAHTKGVTLQDKNDATLNSYTEKITSKSYFNSNRISATARVGYGIFSIFGSYSITNVFKDAVAADTKLLQFGLSISGL
jgi:hypothetical protein